jgi:penicillin-binding protein A
MKIKNKTKSKILFWAVVLCAVQAAVLFLLIRNVYLSGNIRIGHSFPALGKLPQGIDRKSVKLNKRACVLVSQSGKTRVTYTIDPKIQATAERLFEKYDPVLGIMVAVDPETGAIKASAVYSRNRTDRFSTSPYTSILDPAARSSAYPMASISKLVTASAALRAGLHEPGDAFHCEGHLTVEGGTISDAGGGAHGNISMAEAIAKSCNPTFGRIGLEVGRDRLLDEYERFGFNRSIGYDLPLLESSASFGGDRLSMIRAGSGFAGSWMSPIHAALIAAAISNGGDMPRRYIIESISHNGVRTYSGEKAVAAQPFNGRIARELTEMMELTVNKTGGTAYKGFYKNGKSITGDLHVVGKTGSLNGNSDAESFTWFVGFVTDGKPRIAVSALVMNDGIWKIKAASFSGQFFSELSREKN